MEGTWERLEEGKRRGNDVSKKKHLDIKPKNRLALILCGKTAGHMRKNSISVTALQHLGEQALSLTQAT